MLNPIKKIGIYKKTHKIKVEIVNFKMPMIYI